tara:strand:+ start:253 stop:393 length:141 start_codon:yes stop_codon:yes gene_type:complete
MTVQLHSVTDNFWNFITEFGSIISVDKIDYPTQMLAQEKALENIRD